MKMLPSNALILCPTKRFARGLQSQYVQQQLDKGMSSFAAPNIKTLDIWLSEQVDQAYLSNRINPPPRKLNQFEERYLWESVITAFLKQSNQPDLFDIKGLANNCVEANRYCVAWQLDLTVDLIHEETQAFLSWQTLFYQRCEALNALEPVRYLDWQLAHLENGHFELSSLIGFAGFDQAAPQELRLRTLLQAQGSELFEWQVSQSATQQASHLALQDEKHEIRAIMAWVKQQLSLDPSIKLAIVAPQLQNIRQALTSCLDETLQVETLSAAHAEDPRLYNVSLGESLSQQPMIQTALTLIRLMFTYQFEQQSLSTLLLSPFWSASQSEADARALLEAKLREWLPNQVQWSSVQHSIQQLEAKIPLPLLAEHLAQGLAIVADQRGKHKASVWAKVFEQLLTAVHWPGERVESSHEYQAREAWQQCLSQFAQLDFLAESLSVKQAIQWLSQLVKEQVFQPETTGEPAIQVLGIMEALSQPVDAMWVMGMNDNQWPMPARPNPLIPAQIQRQAAVANADDAVQMAFAKTIHQRLLLSAQTVIFSSSLLEGEKTLRASPLMETVKIDTLQTPSWEPLHAQLSHEKTLTDWEWLRDDQAPEVATGEHVRGGTGLIQAQAVCPAWAFYQYRLGAKGLRTPKTGFDAADRGELVHDALESFWMQGDIPRHYVDLAQMSEPVRQAAVAAAVQQSIDQFQSQHHIQYSDQLWTLESERMQRLISEWLAYELQRAIDFKVHACEVEYKVMIQDVEVTLKIDRVHALPDGSLEIVDYKTGAKPSYDSWGTSRITNPQLPIYASYYPAEQTVSSVQFGMVKTGVFNYVGVSADSFDDPPEKRKPKFIQDFESWQDLKSHWLTSIEAIVSEIKAGTASVTFKDTKDLQYCEVLPILRLQERAMQWEQLKQKERLADA